MMTKDRTMKGKLRRFHDRFTRGSRGPLSSSNGSEALSTDDAGPSERNMPDYQQAATGNFQAEQPEVTADPEVIGPLTPAVSSSESHAPSPVRKTVDTSGWDKIWVEAYEKVKEDPRDSKLLAKLELFLEKGEELNDEDDDPAGANKPAQLRTIQKIAEKKLAAFGDARLSVTIGDKPIIVRESIIKAVEVVNSFKTLISGAVAAEPTAALAWAGISTALPILENIFQQDEHAATGLTEITFLLTRYQKFHEAEFTSVLQSKTLSMDSRQQLDQVKDELISVYADILIYEARFILQYATRNKMHRGFRNAFNADEWKTLLSEIQSKCRRIDSAVHDQIDAKTLEVWKEIESIERSTGRIESLQQDTLNAVKDVDRRQLLQSLKVTGNAIFDSRQTSNMEVPCLPGIQLQILKTIQTWAEDPDDTMIFWLEGMAGTGKTSISMTVASSLKDAKGFTSQLDPPHLAFLGASFFFNQVDATRNSTVEFFTTIAWSLSTISPDNGSPIIKAIRDNPGIETKSPQEQFRKLIAGPLAWLDKNTLVPFQLLVVIDALNECDENDAEILLGMLENLVNLSQVRLRLFITSRREEHISTSFRNLPSHLYRTVRLEKVKPSLGQDDDITFYLSKTLEDISTRYRVRDGGISNSDLVKLAKKADGLFIYAVTACRFLNTNQFSNKMFRDVRLSLILEQDQGPQQEVDGIYLKVLSFPDFEQEHETLRHLFYSNISRLIGFIVMLLRPVSVVTLCNLLSKARKDMEYYLGYLHPILNIPDDSNAPVTLIHLSFRDFILSANRSKQLPFSVKELVMHEDIFSRCLEVMNSDLRQNICGLELPGTLTSEVETSQVETSIPQYLRYACRHWIEHLSKMDRDALAEGVLDEEGVVHIFLQEKLLFWLEVLGLIGEAPSIIPIMVQLESLIHASEKPAFWNLARDARFFILENRWIIEHAPMQIYCSSLLFCPGRSRVRSHYHHLIPKWFMTRPDTQGSETAEFYTLHGHSDFIREVAFSPTEALLASVSGDNTTRIWEYNTGSEQYRFEDPSEPLCVSFSTDGLNVASGCWDGTVCVRHLKKTTSVSLSCQSLVLELSFSPTASNILAGLCNDGTLCIWDLDDKQVPVVHYLPAWNPEKLTFSPDGLAIVICMGDLIVVFDVMKAKVVNQLKVLSTPYEMAVSVDSSILAVRRKDIIEFWNIALDEPNRFKSYDTTCYDRSFLILRTDENFTLHHGLSGTIELFEKSTGLLIGKFRAHSGVVSYDGAFLADTSSDHLVIRVFPASSSSEMHQELSSRPGNIELLDENIALSYGGSDAAKIWDVTDGAIHRVFEHVMTVKISPNKNLTIFRQNEGDKFQVWNKDLKQVKATFTNMADIAFVPATYHLITLSLSGELQFLKWNTEGCNYDPTWSFGLGDVVHKDNPYLPELYISPSGQEAIVVCDGVRDGTYHKALCQLWDLRKRTKVKEYFSLEGSTITFSPANDLFNINSDQGYGNMLFHISNGEEVEGCDLWRCQYSLIFHPVELIFAVRARRSNSFTIWEVLPWKEKFRLYVAAKLEVRNIALSAKRIGALSSSGWARDSTIDIWDLATGQKIYSHIFERLGFLNSLNFSTNESWLETKRGRIPLPVQHTANGDLDHEWEGIYNCLYVLDEWVFQGNERLLWLPPEYRPVNILDTYIDVRGGMIALPHKNNSVVFVGIALEKTPLAGRYTRLNH